MSRPKGTGKRVTLQLTPAQRMWLEDSLAFQLCGLDHAAAVMFLFIRSLEKDPGVLEEVRKEWGL